ncbi:MAG: DUF4349 domain-containing protein [Chloroflexi bacterium]|nr:DUF4349 domain-containing protein [Chloroflexota bacterium]MCL5107293.1 DUF4349 domain-containing protein [Chloroflexota bacterium]
MMKATRLALLFLLTALLLVGCSSAATPPYAPSDQAPAPAGATAPRAGESATNTSGAGGSAAQTNWDRYIMRQATLTLTVKDVEAALASVEKVAAAAGGYVAQSASRRDGASVIADITIQVPAAALDQAVADLKGLALVVESAKITSQDVTEEYVDNEASLTNLRAAEQSTQRLLNQATKMDDILSIQRELTAIRGNIEKLQGRQNYLKRRVDMSSIAVHLQPESAAAVAAGRSGWQPLQTVAVAWENSLTLLQGLASLLIMLVVGVLWWLLPLLLLGRWLWARRPKGRPRTPPFPPQPAQPGAA